MNALQAIEKLKEYKKYENTVVMYKGNQRTIRKVVAAPYNLNEFTANFEAYIERSLATVEMGMSDNYDLYFYDNPYASIAFFIRLDDFIQNCEPT